MKKLKQKLGAIAQRVVDWGMGNGLMQEELTADGHDMVTPEVAALARRAGAEGCVLLKNEGTLPLKAGQPVAASWIGSMWVTAAAEMCILLTG